MRHPEYFTSEDLDLYLGEQPQIPLEVDPPRHTKYRRLLGTRNSCRARSRSMSPRCGRSVRGLIDGFAGRGTCDFHEELATPLPSRIFLPGPTGLPREDLPMFLRWREHERAPQGRTR